MLVRLQVVFQGWWKDTPLPLLPFTPRNHLEGCKPPSGLYISPILLLEEQAMDLASLLAGVMDW